MCYRYTMPAVIPLYPQLVALSNGAQARYNQPTANLSGDTMQRQHDRPLTPFLDTAFVKRVRRNHGLEHATMHLLSRRAQGLRLIGRSDARGYWLYGNAPTGLVVECAHEALTRMQQGERQLAVHPNCGTNMVAVALLGAAATFAVLLGSERERFGKLRRLPMVIMGLMGAAFLGQPLGLKLQQHVTTLGDPGDLEIVDIQRFQRGRMAVHRVLTHST